MAQLRQTTDHPADNTFISVVPRGQYMLGRRSFEPEAEHVRT